MGYPQNVTLYQIFSWIRDVNKRLSELFKCKENNRDHRRTMKMSQSVTNVIVWEWMNEFGRWRPYEPNVTQFIENSYQTNSNQVNLGAADSALSSYSIDFITTCQIRLGTGYSIYLLRTVPC